MSLKYRTSAGTSASNFTDLVVKVGDTLPIGTEVDYDGQTAPAGWQEVSSAWTTEQGGKFSYRQVGEIRYIRFNDAEITVTANNWYELGSVPDDYKPSANLFLCGANNGFDTQYIARVRTTGAVGIYPLTSGTVYINGLVNYIK